MMNDAPQAALLPTGMHDLLPPEAEIEAQVVARLMMILAAHGYERVKPPLVEFEETLFSGAGAAMATATFRMMDPASHRMIGVRAEPYEYGAPEAVALELYLMDRARGMPIETPAVRP